MRRDAVACPESRARRRCRRSSCSALAYPGNTVPPSLARARSAAGVRPSSSPQSPGKQRWDRSRVVVGAQHQQPKTAFDYSFRGAGRELPGRDNWRHMGRARWVNNGRWIGRIAPNQRTDRDLSNSREDRLVLNVDEARTSQSQPGKASAADASTPLVFQEQRLTNAKTSRRSWNGGTGGWSMPIQTHNLYVTLILE